MINFRRRPISRAQEPQVVRGCCRGRAGRAARDAHPGPGRERALKPRLTSQICPQHPRPPAPSPEPRARLWSLGKSGKGWCLVLHVCGSESGMYGTCFTVRPLRTALGDSICQFLSCKCPSGCRGHVAQSGKGVPSLMACFRNGRCKSLQGYR